VLSLWWEHRACSLLLLSEQPRSSYCKMHWRLRTEVVVVVVQHIGMGEFPACIRAVELTMMRWPGGGLDIVKLDETSPTPPRPPLCTRWPTSI
jgi:hypothetical protein